MKRAFVGVMLGFAVALAAVAGSCSVNHRSGEFACTAQTDCSAHAGTVCMQGFCILPGAIDAPKGSGGSDAAVHPDANNCPSGCTSCNVAQKTCTIDCSAGANCNGLVSCPTGYHCDIQCKTDNSCRSGVSCVGGASCTIECSGQAACRGIQCGAGPCDVTCSGSDSCRNVSCNNSCACDVLCTGTQSCTNGIQCIDPPLCGSGLGCTSVPVGCHSCM